jgi:hypothetical protein
MGDGPTQRPSLRGQLLRIDWIAVTLFTAWIVSLSFLFEARAKADIAEYLSEESGEKEQPPEKARAGEDKVAADICHFLERRRGHRD